jgi:hypothetical protein
MRTINGDELWTGHAIQIEAAATMRGDDCPASAGLAGWSHLVSQDALDIPLAWLKRDRRRRWNWCKD